MTSFFWDRHLLAVFLLFCLLFLLGGEQVSAKEVGIRLTPSVIEIRPQEDGVIEKSITVENSGRDPLDLALQLRAFTTDKKGEIVYPEDNAINEATKEFLANDIQVLENSIPIQSLSLAPGQKEDLTVKINIKEIHNISQYTISLFFLSQSRALSEASLTEESPIKTQLNLSIGSALHILVFGLHQDEDQTVTITSFATDRYIQRGPVSFITKVKNDSDKYINIHGNITITNVFGQNIGIVRIPNQLIPAGAEKPLSAQATSQIESLVWPEKLLVGNYKAKMTITTDLGEESYAEVGFFAFPLKTVLLTLLALLIASFVIGQVRERVK